MLNDLTLRAPEDQLTIKSKQCLILIILLLTYLKMEIDFGPYVSLVPTRFRAPVPAVIYVRVLYMYSRVIYILLLYT